MTWAVTAIAVTAVSAGFTAYASNEQGKTSAKIANNNAIVADYQAQDAQRRGEDAAIAAQRAARQLGSSQRAGMSARGIDISDGTAADLIDQTDFFGQQDANISRANAAKEAWGLRARKSGFEGEAMAARANGQNAATGSLLGGAAGVSSQWNRYNNPNLK